MDATRFDAITEVLVGQRAVLRRIADIAGVALVGATQPGTGRTADTVRLVSDAAPADTAAAAPASTPDRLRELRGCGADDPVYVCAASET